MLNRMGRWVGLGVISVASVVFASDKKVLFIGIDGLRGDCVPLADAPNLQQLAREGAYSWNAQCEALTFSGPNWSTIASGIHFDKHQTLDNDYKNSGISKWPDFMSRAKGAKSDLICARLVTWDAIEKFQPTDADFHAYYDTKSGADAACTTSATQLLTGQSKDLAKDLDVLFYYLGDVDHVGHAKGFSPQSEPYMAAIHKADEQVGQVLKAMRSRPNYAKENWLIVVTADHGGSMDKGHHGNTAERRTIPFIVWNKDVPAKELLPAPKNVDVARTILQFLDVSIDPAWQLDGRARGFNETPLAPAAIGANLVFNGDAEFDRAFKANKAYDQAVTGWVDDSPNMATVLAYGEDTDHPTAEFANTIQGGKNYFSGGFAPVSRLTQTIDLSNLATEIDTNKLRAKLSACIGGYSSQPDNAFIVARFADVTGKTVKTISLAPVTAGQRKNASVLIPEETIAGGLSGARSVTIEVTFLRYGGEENDGYVDNITLSLMKPAEPKEELIK